MARVSTYLNLQRNTEEVFNFYKSVFGEAFTGCLIALKNYNCPTQYNLKWKQQQGRK